MFNETEYSYLSADDSLKMLPTLEQKNQEIRELNKQIDLVLEQIKSAQKSNQTDTNKLFEEITRMKLELEEIQKNPNSSLLKLQQKQQKELEEIQAKHEKEIQKLQKNLKKVSHVSKASLEYEVYRSQLDKIPPYQSLAQPSNIEKKSNSKTNEKIQSINSPTPKQSPKLTSNINNNNNNSLGQQDLEISQIQQEIHERQERIGKLEKQISRLTVEKSKYDKSFQENQHSTIPETEFETDSETQSQPIQSVDLNNSKLLEKLKDSEMKLNDILNQIDQAEEKLKELHQEKVSLLNQTQNKAKKKNPRNRKETNSSLSHVIKKAKNSSKIDAELIKLREENRDLQTILQKYDQLALIDH